MRETARLVAATLQLEASDVYIQNMGTKDIRTCEYHHESIETHAIEGTGLVIAKRKQGRKCIGKKDSVDMHVCIYLYVKRERCER